VRDNILRDDTGQFLNLNFSHMAKSSSYQARWGVLLTVMSAATLLISYGKQPEPAPKPSQPPPFEFLGAWGDKGDGPGKLNAPVAFAADSLGRVFFADPGSGFVHKFETSGTPLLSFEDSRLPHASGIAVDSGGAIYIADAERGNILIFFPDGTFLRSIRMPPQRQFAGPLGISVDDAGELYVPDPAGSRVVRFNARGRLVNSWKVPHDAPSTDELPLAVAATQDGSAFVAFPKTGRIEKYSPDGSWITSWIAEDASAATPLAITGFAVAGQYVLTLGGAPPRIRVWTFDGQHKVDDNLGGYLDGVAAPQIAVTPGAELLVLDPASPRVFRFRMHL
jgi:DNA-binding beta-propeller fold protein YncE